MRSNFLTGFEKTAIVGAVLGGVGRAAFGAASRAGNVVTRLSTGNFRKPLTLGDRIGTGLMLADAGSTASGYNNKMRSAAMRGGIS